VSTEGSPGATLGRRTLAAAASVVALGGFLGVGGIGVYGYLWNFWVYRGFAPSHDPAFLKTVGSTRTLHIASAAIGGRRQEVLVYLPPQYALQPNRRFPVLYLLHGFPGTPSAFVHEMRMGVLDDTFAARGRAQPLILVMPYGSTGIFTDKEWANGYSKNQGWETFLARDVVRAIDTRYRTIPRGSARAIAGLSEGGYGAINISFHHPGEFVVVESWSGYERADPLRSIFGTSRARLDWNSPAYLLPHVAPALRRHRTFLWLYSGSSDRLRVQNKSFAEALARLHISHHYFVVPGGHDWAVWRRYGPEAYLVAATRLHA
jgi:enterochelin esterase-like enzyme